MGDFVPEGAALCPRNAAVEDTTERAFRRLEASRVPLDPSKMCTIIYETSVTVGILASVNLSAVTF